jgi:chromatin remodeling complex protein RSC6
MDSKNLSVKNNVIHEEFTQVLAQLSGLKTLCSSVINQIKGLEKNVKKQMKKYERDIKKQSKMSKKKPSGFAMPTKVSEKLSNFMGLTEGQQVARTEVTKYIINYIKSNNLQNPDNNQSIIPDVKLNSLFDNHDGEITYFNIQKHMNKHFLK